MRKLLIGLGVLVVLLVAAVLIVPNLIPESVYKERVQTAAYEALGREVTISGPVKVSVFPRIQARASDVTIANAAGFSAEHFAEVDELRAGVALLPLISRRVEVEEFVLMRPTIALEAKADGSNNWTFASDEAAAGGSGGGAFKRRPGALPLEAALGDVRIVDGSASFVDQASGQTRALTDINLALAMPALDQPLTLDGGLALDGEPITLDVRLDSLRAFFDGDEAPFEANLGGDLATLDLDGRFLASEDLVFSGDVAADVPSVRRLAQVAADAALPEGDVYKRFKISGQASGDPRSLAFENARVEFDDLKGDGEFRADLTGDKPRLTGALALGALDVTPYMPAEAAAQAGGGSGGVPPWSEEPIDLTPLKLVNADFNVTATSIKARDIEIGESVLKAQIRDGRMTVDLERMGFYGGEGVASLVADARGSVPQYVIKADLTQLSAQPFLEAAAKFSKLAGVGSTSLDLTASGRSQAEIMRSLSGTGGFDFRDGAITGVNLAAVLRGVEQALQGNLSRDAFSSNQTTDFSELTGLFDVTNGVAKTREFTMVSPLLRVTGDGALNVADQSVDFLLTPKAVASLEGQGGATDIRGLAVPVRIKGAWNNTSIGVDTQGLQNALADRARGAVAGELEGLLSGDGEGEGEGGGAEGVLRNLLGLPSGADDDEEGAEGDAAEGDAAEGEEADAEEEDDDPVNKALQGLFGRDD